MRQRLLIALICLLVRAGPATAQVFGQNQNITVIDSGTACVTAPAACATFALDSVSSSVTLSISGTWTGTLTFEGTNNDGIWTVLLATNTATGAQATTTTASGLFAVGNGGVIKVRVRATAAVTGSALVTAARGSGSSSRSGVGGSGLVTSAQVLCGDGTALLPCYSFASEPTKGFWSSGAGVVTLQGGLTLTGNVIGSGSVFAAGAGVLGMTGRLRIESTANGLITLANNGDTNGSVFRVDVLPTVGSGFGASPAVIAGSTPFAGAVNVGTGGAATSGVIAFGGTAYPSAPFCTYSTQTTNAVTRGVPTTTQLTLSSTTAWTASDIVSWICVSSK